MQGREGERWVEHEKLILAPALGPLGGWAAWDCERSSLYCEWVAGCVIEAISTLSPTVQEGPFKSEPRFLELETDNSDVQDFPSSPGKWSWGEQGLTRLLVHLTGTPFLNQWNTCWWPQFKSFLMAQLRTSKGCRNGSPSGTLGEKIPCSYLNVSNSTKSCLYRAHK